MSTELTESNFDKEVLGESGTVLVDFYTEACPPCRMMAPVLNEIATERAGRLKVVKVDAAANAPLAARYRISAVPTLILFQNGQVTKQRTGACSKKDLLTWIDP